MDDKLGMSTMLAIHQTLRRDLKRLGRITDATGHRLPRAVAPAYAARDVWKGV